MSAPGSDADVPATPRLWTVAAIGGGMTLVAGLVAGSDRAWAAWLVAGEFVLGLGLGGLFFVSLLYVTGSSWAVAFRRVPEAMAATLPASAIAILALLLFRPSGYPWFHGLAAHEGPLAAFKVAWLSYPFFVARAVAYFVVWIVLASALVRQSRHQDLDGDERHSSRNVALSAGGLVLFAITVSLASFDWIMSLEPNWYSTIFAVYQFAGLFQSALAAMIIAVVWLHRRGPLRDILGEHHLHDLGKLLFAFSSFWMYIWFSQYMLIWYTNIPEETSYFVLRQKNGWFALFIINIFLNWAIPFLVLLRRDTKRHRRTIGLVAAVVLLGRWLDVYLMIFPGVVGESPTFGLWEIGLTLGGIGGFGLVLAAVLKGAPAVPVSDPELVESLEYH